LVPVGFDPLFVFERALVVSQIDSLKRQVEDLVTQPLAAEECELVEAVIATYKKSVTVRLFVHSRRGTTLAECARLSRLVGALVDDSEMFPNGYNLEVSSPGLDRPLKTAADFRRNVGETVTIQFVDVKKKAVTAKIVSGDEIAIMFENKSGGFSEKLADIKAARIVV